MNARDYIPGDVVEYRAHHGLPNMIVTAAPVKNMGDPRFVHQWITVDGEGQPGPMHIRVREVFLVYRPTRNHLHAWWRSLIKGHVILDRW